MGFVLMRVKLAVLLSLLSATVAYSQESMMQDVSYPLLEKLITLAKTNYPKVKTFDHRVTSAQLKVNYAIKDWFNILTFAYFPNNAAVAAGSTNNAYQFGFSTSIGTILQKPNNVKLAREDRTIAELDQAEYNLNIETEVKKRYFDYVREMTLLSWRTRDLQNNESIMTEMKYKFEKGEETFDNYERAITSYSNTVQTKITAEGALLEAKSSLEEMIGVPLESVK